MRQEMIRGSNGTLFAVSPFKIRIRDLQDGQMFTHDNKIWVNHKQQADGLQPIDDNMVVEPVEIVKERT